MLFLLSLEYFGKLFFGGRFVLYEISLRLKSGERFVLRIIVIKKLTFPNDKVLTIEISEKQISGRTITINIDYEDVLSADSFNNALLREE